MQNISDISVPDNIDLDKEIPIEEQPACSNEIPNIQQEEAPAKECPTIIVKTEAERKQLLNCHDRGLFINRYGINVCRTKHDNIACAGVF